MQTEQREKRQWGSVKWRPLNKEMMTRMSGWGEKTSGTKQQFEILASEHFNTLMICLVWKCERPYTHGTS